MPKSILNSIPLGFKSNVYFVIDNNQNMVNQKEGKPGEFADDCGSWILTASPTSYHLKDSQNNVTKVFKHMDQYCRKVMIKRKRAYKPLEPQPTQEDVLKIQRFYFKLKLDQSCKKRITWIENEGCKKIACIEYLGDFACNVENMSSDREVDHDLEVNNVKLQGAQNLPMRKSKYVFLSIRDLLHQLSSGIGLSEIPIGYKNNVFFLINDSQNSERRADGIKGDHVDDCGAWSHSPCPVTYYIVNELE